MSKESKQQKSIATRAVRAGLESDVQHGSVVPPIYLSTNFAFEDFRKPRKYDYTRSGNPTRDQLAGALADLEGGAGAVITCTGLAAITLLLATLPAGARVLAPVRLLRWDLSFARGFAPPRHADRGFRRSEQCRSARRSAGAQTAARLDRDAEQSAAADRRHSCDCGMLRTPPAHKWWSTIPFSRRCGSSRWRSVPTSFCIRPPST